MAETVLDLFDRDPNVGDVSIYVSEPSLDGLAAFSDATAAVVYDAIWSNRLYRRLGHEIRPGSDILDLVPVSLAEEILESQRTIMSRKATFALQDIYYLDRDKKTGERGTFYTPLLQKHQTIADSCIYQRVWHTFCTDGACDDMFGDNSELSEQKERYFRSGSDDQQLDMDNEYFGSLKLVFRAKSEEHGAQLIHVKDPSVLPLTPHESPINEGIKLLTPQKLYEIECESSEIIRSLTIGVISGIVEKRKDKGEKFPDEMVPFIEFAAKKIVDDALRIKYDRPG